MTVETTVIATAVALWFAQGWYLNTRLERVHAKLDRALECFDGLRDYLYEIDPQFDEERRLLSELDMSLNSEKTSFAGLNHMELIRKKEAAGKRTLNTPFHNISP
jgi:hypothetical protein